MTLTEAMAYKFLVRQGGPAGQVVQLDGKNMQDEHLKHYADNGKGHQQAAAAILLDKSEQTRINGSIVRVQKPAAKPQAAAATPVCLEPNSVPDEYQEFMRVTADSHGSMIVDERQPEWATTYFKRLDEKIEFIMDALEELKKQRASAPQATAPAAGVGQWGGAQFEFATRAVLEHKNGKVYVNFWNDDNAKLKYSVIYGAKPAAEWHKLLPWVNPAYFSQMSDKEWFNSFPELDRVGQFPCRCNVYYTLSSKLNKEGNPFRDIQRIEQVK